MCISDEDFRQATVSLTMYYTPTLRDSVQETGISIKDSVQSLVRGANRIFRESGIPLMLSIQCMLKWDKTETDPLLARQTYTEFKKHRGSIDNLRNGADIAVLLTEKNLQVRVAAGTTRPM